MSSLKRAFKQNTHNLFFKALAGFGRSMNRLYENRNHDIYSNGEVTILKKLNSLNPSVIIDGGANIGKYTKEAHKFCKTATIYSFEPVPSTFEILTKNLRGLDRVVPVKEGLYKETCKKEMIMYASHTHSSIFQIDGGTMKEVSKIDVALTAGDDFIQSRNISAIDLLKLDVEGAELEAIMGFEKSLRKGIIRAIQFEYGYINISSKNLLIDYYKFLTPLGYVIGKIYPKSVEFREYSNKHEDFIGPNFLAVRKSDAELIKILS